MHWSKKNKGIVIFLIVIVAVVLLCLGDYGLRYYDTPKEETYDYFRPCIQGVSQRHSGAG